MKSEQGFAMHNGSAIIVGCAHDGRVRWVSGIEKTVTITDYRRGMHYHFGSLRPNLTTEGVLEVLYRDGFTVGIRRFKLIDGSPAAVGSESVVEPSNVSLPFTSTTTWISKRSLVMLSQHGSIAPDMAVNRIDY